MNRLSLNARRSHRDQYSAEVEVVLFQFDHPALAAPIRLSTDPTERLTTDPLTYGTRSIWSGSDPRTEPFLFALVSAEMPGDQEDAPAGARLIVSEVDRDIAILLRSFTDPATVHMAMVLAGTPDVVEIEYRDMLMIACEGSGGDIPLTLSRRPIEGERAPKDRFTPDRFPGLWR